MTTLQPNLTVVKATSTARSALSDPFNLFMLIPSSVLAIFCLLLSISPSRSIVVFMIFVLVSTFVFFYVRAIMHRELEISTAGIRYREASLRLFFPWEEIEGIKVEQWKKQITIWRNGKFRRIHEFGLPATELMLVRRALHEQIATHHIPLH